MAALTPPIDPEKEKLYSQWLDDFKNFQTKLEKSTQDLTETFEKTIIQLVTKAKSSAGLKRFGRYNAVLDAYMAVGKRYMNMHLSFIRKNNFHLKGGKLRSIKPSEYDIDLFRRTYMDTFAERVANILDRNFDISELDGDDKEILEARRQVIFEKIDNDIRKLCLLYNNTPNIMDLIFNTQFFVVYALKLVRLAMAYGALFLASKLFQQNYVSEVFANNKEPPALSRFILLFWAFETGMIVLMLVILVLLKYVFNTEYDDFIINNTVLKKFLIDYVACTVLVLAFSFIISSTMMKKKYFKYKADGLRAVRALQELIFYVACVIYTIPFYIVVP
jgi:hypothetical protein